MTVRLTKPRRLKHEDDTSGKSRRAKQYRRIAEMLNPSPFVQVLDSRGRPRRAPRHTDMKV
ncbi:MAG: hypothetical protein JNK47_12730 [Mesorhizobium sp.]|nr:hypothetical protein [Mesorhizobium sp.]MBL8578085.1 hypothetical protein [Mesorhizobium sp.]